MTKTTGCKTLAVYSVFGISNTASGVGADGYAIITLKMKLVSSDNMKAIFIRHLENGTWIDLGITDRQKDGDYAIVKVETMSFSPFDRIVQTASAASFTPRSTFVSPPPTEIASAR